VGGTRLGDNVEVVTVDLLGCVRWSTAAKLNLPAEKSGRKPLAFGPTRLPLAS
jgi:hypothetical protein